MRKVWKLAVAALAALFICMSPILACDEYLSFNLDETKSLRNVLVQPDADPLDRLYAFEQLACSSKPTLRAYAVREGMKAAKDSLVREQILFTALFSKTSIDVELISSATLTKRDKEFVRQVSNVYSLLVKFRLAENGCISLYYTDRCQSGNALLVRGSKVELNYDDLIGRFELADDNTLVGFVRASGRSEYSKIPARIRLD